MNSDLSSDLYIIPQKMLRDRDGTFVEGNGAGLLALTQQTVDTNTLGKCYFQKLFIDYTRKLSSFGEMADVDLSKVYALARPSIVECGFMALSAPPLTGGEYFDGELLYQFYLDFEAVIQEKFSVFAGSFTEFLCSLSPTWKNVGKVSFHLAENKGDITGRFPFAFMVSFIYRNKEDKPRHLPLASALKAYANDRASMMAVISPIQIAAKKSELIRNLLESRRIFQPVAWSSDDAYQFLQDIPLFEESNIVVRIVNLWKTAPPKAKVSMVLDVEKKKLFNAASLMNFSMKVTLGGEKLTEKEIQELLHSGGGLIRLKGQWIKAEPEKIAELLTQWKNAEDLAAEGGMTLGAGLRLLAGIEKDGSKKMGVLDEENCSFEASGALKKFFKQLSDPSQIKVPVIRKELKDTLRPYQYDGVKYLWQTSTLGFGTCLADDMGLGKTLQLLTLICLWKKARFLANLPAILVLPATLLANWKNESAKFTPDLKIMTLHASVLEKGEFAAFKKNPKAFLSSYDMVLVTYAMVPRLPQLATLDFPAVIADEAQAIKNPNSKQSRAVRKLRGRMRIALTGTPVENRLTDLWSIFDFVNPGLLGNLRGFIAFSKELHEDYTPLRKLTQPFILRRLKTDKHIIKDLPDKTDLKVYCNLTKHQAVLYAHCVEQMERTLNKETEGIKRRGVVLSYLMQFKQICNHPAQYLGSGDYSARSSGKFLRLGKLIEDISSRQEKVLVFTQFREIIEPLRDFLCDCFGRDGLVIHGGTPVKKRAELVKEFQLVDGPPFFVLSLKAAGTGLNLTAANHVIHFDRWWNSAVENQASDRAYRIGQKRNVLVHKFICRGTLEEKIDELIMSKQNLADELLNKGAEKLLTSMDNNELVNFVKLDSKQLEDF